MSAADFRKLADLFPNETVTHSYVQDIQLPAVDGTSPGTFALVTLDNGLDHSKPTTLGPNTLIELGTVLEGLKERAARGEIVGVGVTGKPYFLVAGADLSTVKSVSGREHGLWMAQLGHDVYSTLANLGVPSFAFINGLALGGGLEIALQSTYRTVSTGAGALALPEAFIGLIPGWGGVYILPRLIGPENAVKVMIENPLSNNRTLTGPQAFELGVADAMFEPADFVEQSVAWAAQVIAGAVTPERANAVDPADPEVAARWAGAVAAGRAFVEAKTSNASPAPAKVLEVMEANRTLTQAQSAELECETLADLMQTDEFRSTVYAFLDLVQRRSKRPAGAPDRKLARPVTKIGVVGAGLMASQLALLFARQLKVPVVMTDIDQARVDKGVGYVHAEVDKLLQKGRISPDAANRTRALVTGSVSKEAFADADFVIEAVFEELNVKKQVFKEVGGDRFPGVHPRHQHLLAVRHRDGRGPGAPGTPGRLPLLQPRGRDAAAGNRPRPEDRRRRAGHRVRTGQRPQEVRRAGQGRPGVRGQPPPAAPHGRSDGRLRRGHPGRRGGRRAAPDGPADDAVCLSVPWWDSPSRSTSRNPPHRVRGPLPGLAEPAEAHRQRGEVHLGSGLGEGRQARDPCRTLALMSFGDSPSTAEEVLRRTQDALAEEIGLMLDEGVVAGPEDIDLCMILGAGWPMFLGGITPYLDRVGASERVNGKKFLAPGVASEPAVVGNALSGGVFRSPAARRRRATRAGRSGSWVTDTTTVPRAAESSMPVQVLQSVPVQPHRRLVEGETAGCRATARASSRGCFEAGSSAGCTPASADSPTASSAACAWRVSPCEQPPSRATSAAPSVRTAGPGAAGRAARICHPAG